MNKFGSILLSTGNHKDRDAPWQDDVCPMKRAVTSPYRRPYPLFASKETTESFIREAIFSDKTGHGNCLSTHQFNLQRKECAVCKSCYRQELEVD